MDLKAKAIRYLKKNKCTPCEDEPVWYLCFIKEALDIAIQQAKKEVFGDIEKWAIKFYGKNWHSDEALGDIKELRKLREKHLNTRSQTKRC